MISILAALLFQCPDGSPPPCQARAPRIDTGRVVVLPFRVSAADTLLGEGLADLLANELTGEGVPRAVDVGAALRAWRRAGGSLRRPLPQADALRLARDLRAGFLVEGSVVRLGRRATISTSVVSTTGGSRRRLDPVSGDADSMELLVRTVTNRLLAAFGVDARPIAGAQLSDDPAANRLYLQGLAAYRRGRFAEAANALEGALAMDSTFATAAYLRGVVAGWYDLTTNRWFARAWELREGLSGRPLLAVTARFGAEAERARAGELLGNPSVSADARYHRPDPHRRPEALLEEIRAGFEAELVADTSIGTLQHLMEIGAYTADTAFVRSLSMVFERRSEIGWAWSWLAAAVPPDQRRLAALRRRAAEGLTFDAGFHVGTAIQLAAVYGVRPEIVDEMYALALPLIPRAAHWAIHQGHAVAAATHGRSEVVRETLRRMDGPNPFSGYTGDALAVVLALFAGVDSVIGAEAAERLSQQTGGDTMTAPLRRCVLALWRRRPLAGPIPAPGTAGRCLRALDLFLAPRDADIGPLDSVIVADVDSSSGFYAGFENVLRARAWAARGDSARALVAVRSRPYGLSNVLVDAESARLEGRLAAAAGDTTGAIAAYQRYLRMRASPEPRLAPQRDSVIAELRAVRGR